MDWKEKLIEWYTGLTENEKNAAILIPADYPFNHKSGIVVFVKAKDEKSLWIEVPYGKTGKCLMECKKDKLIGDGNYPGKETLKWYGNLE